MWAENLIVIANIYVYRFVNWKLFEKSQSA